MSYDVRTSSEAARDIEEAAFYKEGLGMMPDNVLKFKKDVLSAIRRLEESPKAGANLSARIDIETNVKYNVIDDYILFYEIEGEVVKVVRLLPAKSNWMNVILKYL